MRVPCPYFDPLEPWDPDAGGASASRLPLGQPFRGFCTVREDSPTEPDPETQMHICNTGYARGRCADFPITEAIDAVRFSTDASGRGDGVTAVIWIEESDHRPLHFGNEQALPEGSVRRRQARAFARSIDEGKVR